jgi:hypothetical protein
MRRRKITGYALSTYHRRFEELGSEAWAFMGRNELTPKEAQDIVNHIHAIQKIVTRANGRTK